MATRKRAKRRTRLVWAVIALLALEAGLVSAVFLSPGFASRLQVVAAGAERAWTGTRASPGIPARVGGAFERAYRDWIAPLRSGPTAPTARTAFARCASCHRDYASKRRFTSVYMNHPRHAQYGVACATCHVETAHPNPAPPEEAVCARCHREVSQRGKCGLCHPPASLPHFYLLGAPREGPVDCGTCHRRMGPTRPPTKPLAHLTGMNGTNPRLCASCHPASTCKTCHGAPHPPNWIKVHGQQVGWGGQVGCTTCHTGKWCADRCHASGAIRPPPSTPMPTGSPP